MSQERFLRTLPGGSGDFSRKFDFWRAVHLDPVLLVSLLVLAAAGLFVLYSASGQDLAMVERQMTSFALGFTLMIVLAQIPPRTYRAWSPWFYGGGVVLLVAVALFGKVSLGAQRWLDVPGLPRFQPSELLKLAMPMMLAWYLSDKHLPPRLTTVLGGLVLVFVPVLLIAEQPDLGTAILVMASGIFVLFLAGLPWWMIVSVVTAAVPFGWFAWKHLLHDYQRQRVMTLFDPESDPLGTGWNIMQSKTAIGSGGLWGKGYLHGTQSHLEYLPEGHTDFIVAAFSEEMGLLGVTLLLLLYAFIIGRCLYLSSQGQDTYGRLLAGAITLAFFVYVFVNIGMVSGILPVVGVPLPFVSYGGTAVVTLLSGFGLLMSIHSHRKLI